jgi:glycosyltransferase involved in cell wall biosynthesis
MRVLHVIGRMNVGGPAALLVALLDAPGLDVHALVGGVGVGEADYLDLRAPAAEVTRVPGLGPAVAPTDDVRALYEIVRQMRRLRPDIVHTHTAKAGALGRVAATATGVPARVHTFHGHLLHGYFSPAMTRSIVVAERALARVTDRLVAVGANVRDELLDRGIGRPDQFVVIPPGVALSAPVPGRPEARAALGLDPEGPVVAYVARLTKVKRPDRMIEVARMRPEAMFVVAGDGPLQGEIRSGAPPNVRFLGWRADIENVYAAADVILLTSDNEGMPVGLIEAALCGVPAVATDVGSTREVVIDGRTGRTLPPDARSLAEATGSLLSDEDQRYRMGAAARLFAEENFGVPKMIEMHAALYESLMADPPSRLRRRL